MDEKILDYLHTQRVGVLAVEMLDGSPHAATVHVAQADSPLIFYFETYRHYRKSEALFGRATSRASLVIGADERDMKTLQFDGTIRLVTAEEKAEFDRVYFAKFPEKKEKSIDPKYVFFSFTPTWWRFTDWTTPQGKTVITSDGQSIV